MLVLPHESVRAVLVTARDLEEGVGRAEKALFVAQLVGREGHHQVVACVMHALTSDLHATTM